MIKIDRAPDPRPGHVGDLHDLTCDGCSAWFGADADYSTLISRAYAEGWRRTARHPISGRRRHQCPECAQ